MSLKMHYPDIAFSGNQVEPEEMDQYTVYSVNRPYPAAAAGSITQWFGTAAGTSTTSPTYGVINLKADYPRNLRMVITCAAGSTKGGTAVFTGKNQFGYNQIESLGIAVAADGGTVVGTKVFAEVSSAVVTMGTSNAGVGTVSVAGDVVGTTALFGLPVRLGGTTDVKNICWVQNGAPVSVNGGTIAAFVDVPTSSIKAVKTVDGTTYCQVWVKSTADNSGSVGNVCNW
jgi:hypothetical protein